MDEELAPTSPEASSYQPVPPKTISFQTELGGMSEQPYEAISRLPIDQSELLEIAKREIQALGLQSGDKFIFTAGKLEIFRKSERLGEWIVDEERKQIEQKKEEQKCDILDQTGRACGQLAEDIEKSHLPMMAETTQSQEPAPTPTIPPESKEVQKISSAELQEILIALATGYSKKDLLIPWTLLAGIVQTESGGKLMQESAAWARGPMGIRDTVLRDIAIRPQIYARLFQNIPDALIQKIEPTENAQILKEVKQSICRLPKKPTTEEIAGCRDGILQLQELVHNPIVNCILGSSYYASIAENPIQPDAEKWEDILSKIRRGTVNFFRGKKHEKAIKKESFAGFIEQLRHDPVLKERFMALVRYNAGPNSDPKPWSHPYVYATLVLLHEPKVIPEKTQA